MHSDWDDAPERARKRSNNNVFRWTLAGVAVAAAVLIGLLGGLDDIQLDLPLRSAEAPAPPQRSLPLPDAPSAPARLQQPAASQMTAEELFWAQEHARQQAPIRQTSFNDSNYSPSGNVNVIASTPVRSPVAQQDRQQRARTQGLTGSGIARVVWEDARGRRTSWQTPFTYRDGTIDNASFCMSLGKGSIDYRNCRKGAHSWLKEQCRSRQAISREARNMYCHAEGAFRT